MIDMGHDNLLNDINKFFKDVTEYQYHDFKNSIYDAPKLALVKKLEWLINNTKDGKYDNFESER
jgi:hypothetical protein